MGLQANTAIPKDQMSKLFLIKNFGCTEGVFKGIPAGIVSIPFLPLWYSTLPINRINFGKQDPSLVDAMNGANKVRSYDIPPSTLSLKFGAAPPKAAAKPAAKAAPKPAAKPAARAAPKPAAKPAAKPATGRPGSVRK